MSGIVLSASVRQNLLSLQSTADLLATTQNRLATGKKVNSALDNPTNFFTAQSLDNRASDINNLLDRIPNRVPRPPPPPRWGGWGWGEVPPPPGPFSPPPLFRPSRTSRPPSRVRRPLT